VQRADPIEMEEIAQNIQFLPDTTLREIAKGPLVKFALSCPDNKKVSRVWQSLIQTLSTPSLSHSHTSAACNATSAFLDAAASAENEETRELALSSETWLAVFDVFLNRYEDAKPKPLKQLLGSLTPILAKHYQGSKKTEIQTAVVDAIIPSIILGEPRSRLKACLVCLEVFIRKSAISPSEMIPLVRQWLSENYDRWTPVFEKDRVALSLDSCEATSVASVLSDELAARIFILGLLTQTNNKEMATSSGVMLSSFLQQMKSERPEQQLSPMWVAPVRHMVLQNVDTLEAQSNRLFQPIFTLDPTGFRSFVNTLPLQSLLAGDMTDAPQQEYMLLFAALRVGKKVNLVHDDYDLTNLNSTEDGTTNSLVLKSEVLGHFLLHNESNIRIAALSLLITAFSTIKPLTTAATNAILRGLPSMHADSDSYTRGEIMSLTRKFIVRLKGGILDESFGLNTLAPSTGKQPLNFPRSDVETRHFLREYLHFLEKDLRVTASYQRHISSLKALKLLIESGLDPRTEIKPAKSEVDNHWKFKMDVFGPRLLRLLVDLLMDPFDEVRHTSLSILNLFPRDILLHSLLNTPDEQPSIGMRLTDAVARAENIASKTSRADHADTVARLYHVLFCAALPHQLDSPSQPWWATKTSVVDTIVQKLEQRLSSPQGLFHSAMREAPLHGYMSGLRYILLMPNFHSLISDESGSGSWRSVHDRVVAICDKVWLEVKPVLCVDSPEGHTDEPIEDLSVGPKDILSYSWRALRESSLLLYATVHNVTYGPNGGKGLQRADFAHIGRASFTQLAELRHRGAFSTVSQTFTTCCQRCSESNDPSIRELLPSWYQEAKTIIFETASKLTRRSAGLPALVTGILCADPGTPFFKHALNELHEISRLPVEYDKKRQYLELPQVHAMNCLKDIFTNTKLGPFTEAFIMPALTLSAERLGSPIWALRNSGLMLFRALLTKMCRLVPGSGPGFGGRSGSEPGARISFPKYPGLLELLSRLLTPTTGPTTEGSTDIITERVFPALELVGEKVPTIADNGDTMIRGLVLEHLKSPVWGIREHAARVYASLLTREHILEGVRGLVEFPRAAVTENHLHGTVLCVRYALRRFSSNTNVLWKVNTDELLTTVRCVLATVFPLAKSPIVATDLIEILNDTLERSIEAQVETSIAHFVDELFQTHDLHGIKGHVFNASWPGWNLSSSTRSSSLLRRALAWCTILKMLSLGQWHDITTFYHGVSLFDANAARWVSERLHEKLGALQRYRKPLAELYSSVIMGSFSTEVKIIAVSNLACILEDLLVLQLDAAQSLVLPWENIGKSFQPEMDIQAWNREATDAELRLRGCLLNVRISLEGKESLSAFESDLESWSIKLRSALSEETEFTTRHAAVASLWSFARALRPSASAPRTSSGFLRIYLVLYDMLNDDAEELRDMAAATASWVLSYSSVSPGTAVALAPLNASSLLVEFIVHHYSDSNLLAERAIRYMLGQEPRVSGFGEPKPLIAVSDLVAEYGQESTVLFVEEKQNLFIDEVREVDVWSQALLRFKKDAYPESLVRELSHWVSGGLAYLSAHAAGATGQDGLLGWVSKSETFTLGARIIGLASVLASEGFVAAQYLSDNRQELRDKLQLLLDAGQTASIHEEWLWRIKASLEGERS
ncbi:hypothetical protein NUU61_008477, partial [Penicillium alfredii]